MLNDRFMADVHGNVWLTSKDSDMAMLIARPITEESASLLMATYGNAQAAPIRWQ